MRKTIMLGTFIALFSAGALAHAQDVTTSEPGAASGAARPAVRVHHDRERHHEYRSGRGHHEVGHDGREHHDEAHERRHESREHGWRR
jgi:uncharacterized GH25 family protein